MLGNFRPSKKLVIELSVLLLLTAGLIVWLKLNNRQAKAEELEEPVIETLYDIPINDFVIENHTVESGETLSHILGNQGIGAVQIDRMANTVQPVFDVRQIRQGNNYSLFLTEDSLQQRTLHHFVYQKSVADYVVISFEGDSVSAREGHKDVKVNRRKVTADIKSSLWNCIVEHELPVALSCDLEDIFGWSVDFFGLQQGDEFTAVFEEKFIDSVRIGTGRVWGAVFNHNGKQYYAIPFDQNGKIEYWDEQGNSLKKQLLKAPLKFSRISSRFSNARLHPVLRVYRPHHGVDYAAPSGTPVMTVADGTVTRCGWDGSGGGNMIRIKHANNLETCYMHLRGFAQGVRAGSHVSQGQTIGYVGTTGRSTGPHLDFRIYVKGKAVDPLKMTSPPVEPLRKESMPAFNAIKERVLAELQGEVSDSVKITMRDLEPDMFKEQTDSTTVSKNGAGQ